MIMRIKIGNHIKIQKLYSRIKSALFYAKVLFHNRVTEANFSSAFSKM